MASEDLIAHLRIPVDHAGRHSSPQQPGASYVMLHVDLARGASRQPIEAAIRHVVTELPGFELQRNVYAVPHECGNDARAEAELVWEQVMLAATGGPQQAGHLWLEGDSVTVHFCNPDGGDLGLIHYRIQHDGEALPTP